MPLSKASLERLVEASPDMVIATDSGGTVAYYNDGARENLGYAREEIIGRSVVQLYPSFEEARRVMRAMRDPGEGGKGRVVNFPTTFVAKDGSELPVAISARIRTDPRGGEQGTIGFAKDLREFIRKDQLAVLGEVAIGLAHQINNPLAVILNQLSLLERYVVAHAGESELERIRRIRRETDRIEAQLRRLSEMAEQEQYSSTGYIGDARMIDLSTPEHSETPELAGPLAGQQLLVVDDDRGVRDSVAEVLRAEGASVDTASDGKEAIAKLDRRSYAAVVSDVVMPEMDGYELFKAVRAGHPETKVVLMTAFYYDKDHILKRSRMEGLDGVLFKKPVDPARLIATLSELISSPPPDPS